MGPALMTAALRVKSSQEDAAGFQIMKNYRCVFIYAGGHTTIEVSARNSDHAIDVAATAINTGDYDGVEVWADDQVLLTKNTRRAWDRLGNPAATSDQTAPDPATGFEPATGQSHAQISASRPRRAASSLAAGLEGHRCRPGGVATKGCP
jgi:hypothetical protein